jgi:hypothetical protein
MASCPGRTACSNCGNAGVTTHARRRGQALPSARSCADSPPAPASGGASPHTAAPRTCPRIGPRGRAVEHHSAPARPRESRHDVDLPARDRPRGDHRHRAHAPRANDVRQRLPAALIQSPAATSGSATALPAPLWPNERPDATGGPRPTQERRRGLRTRSLARERGRGVVPRLSPPHRAFHRAGLRATPPAHSG